MQHRKVTSCIDPKAVFYITLLFNKIILLSIYVSYILVLSYFHPSNLPSIYFPPGLHALMEAG